MKKIIYFVAVGSMGTALHYAILYILVASSLLLPGAAAMVGATFGALFNYYVNRKYTFDSDSPHIAALPKYILMSICSVAITGIIVSMAVRLDYHYLVGQIVATAVALVLNFTVSNRLIFQK